MSKLVKKAAEHAARKNKTQYTLKPHQLDEYTINKFIGVAIVITTITLFAVLAAMLG